MTDPCLAAIRFIDYAMEHLDLSGKMRAELQTLRARAAAGEVVQVPTEAGWDRFERMQVEAGGPIPARFKHLQHLNRRR